MEKKRGRLKRKPFVIAVATVLCAAAAGGIVALARGPVAVEARQDEELRRMLAQEGDSVIEWNETLELTEPLVVNGNKEITGSGTITFAPAARMQAGLHNVPPRTSAQGSCADETGFEEAAADLYALVVAPGGSLKLGGVAVNGAGIGNGVLVQAGAALEMRSGSVTGGFYYNVAGAGEVRLAGGTLSGAGSHNLYLASGASLVMTGGTLQEGGHDGIYAENGAALEITGGTVTQNARHGLHNAGTAAVAGGSIANNQNNIENCGALSISGVEIDGAQVNGVRNMPGGTLVLSDVEITNSGANGIVNRDGAVLKAENLLVRRTGARGIDNSGGHIEAENVTIYSCGAVALENRPGTGAAGGNVAIDGLTISGASGMNVVQGSAGTMTLENSSIGLTAVTSVQVVTGSLVLNHVTIEGTTGTGAGIWVIGGKADIQNCIIKDTKGRGIAIAGGEVTGNGIEFSNIASVGIDNMPNNDGISTGKATFTNLTFTGGLRDNVANTSGGEMSISNATLGVTAANNVRVTDGVLRLTNVDIQGTRASADGESSYHGIYARGGTVYVNNSRISNCVAGGIRNRGGNVYATGLTVANTKGSAISNGTFSDGTYGNITLDGVKISGAQLGNILNECPGTFTGKNLVLEPCVGNSIHIKEGTMVLDNVDVRGTLPNDKGSAHHCVYAPGGKLTISNSRLANPTTSGIRNTGAEVVCDNVTLTGVPVNNVSASGGTTLLRNCTLEHCTRTSVNITGGEAVVTLDGTRVLGAGDTSGSNNMNCVYIAPGTKLVVAGDTLITGSASRAGVLNEGGTFVMRGGSISGNAQRGVNNAVKKEGGVSHVPLFEMHGGAIHGNGNAAVSGGGVYNGGRFVMHGGSIYENRAHTGGAINTAAGSETLVKGGEIYANTAVKTGNNGNGGAIHGSGGAVISITGGRLHGNVAEGKGGAVCHNAESLVLGGTAVISGDNDIYLVAGKAVQIEGAGIGNTVADPVCLTAETSQYGTILVSASSDEAARAVKPLFRAKGDAFSLAKFGRHLAVGDVDDGFNFVARIGTTYYPSLAAAFAAVPNGGTATIVVLDDMELTGAVDINGSGKNITLTDDGSGPYTISRANSFTSGRMFILRVGNTLTLAGSSGSDAAPGLIFDGRNVATGNDSQVIAVGASAANWNATLYLQPGVKFTNNKNGNGGTAMIVNGTLHMSGGVLENGTTADNGGAVFVHNTGTMHMSGGAIAGNSGNNGGGVYVNGTGKLMMTGGAISGNSSAQLGKDVYVAGSLSMEAAAAIEHVHLPTGKTIALAGNVTSAGPITVTMADYAPGTQVLAGDAGVLAASAGKFKPANTRYSINSAGRLEGEPAYVAQIGATKYTSLAAAFAAVPNDGTATIVVLDDIELTGAVDIAGSGKNITLTDDGSGPYTISRANSFTSGRMFILRVGNTLTLAGSSGNDAAPGLIFDGRNVATGNDSQVIAVGASTANWDATLYLQPGVKFTNNKNGNGGTAMIVNGTLHMSGGVLENGTTADNGGAIYIGTAGTAYISGGAITGNSGKNGGGIYAAPTAAGRLAITGGAITGNTAAERGADVYAVAGLSMGGAPAVGNMFLPAGKTIALTGNVTSAGPITVTMADYTPGTQVLAGDAGVLAASAGKFKPANTRYSINSAGCLEGEPDYVAQIGATKYTSLAAAFAAVPDGGTATIVVLDDIELTAPIDIPQDKNKNITLTDDGSGPYTISRANGFTAGRMFILRKGNTLTLAGSSGNDAAPGLIFDGRNVATGNDSQAISVGTSAANWDATLYLQPGVKFTNNKNGNGGTAVIVFGTLHMSGGVLENGTTPDNGGAIYVHTAGTAYISGGAITGNSGKNGGGIYAAPTAAGRLVITGGAITGNTAAERGADVYAVAGLSMGGAPAVGSMFLPAGKTIALTGNVTSAVPITVTMADYAPGTQVLAGDAGVLAASHTRFTPAAAGIEIGADGKLAQSAGDAPAPAPAPPPPLQQALPEKPEEPEPPGGAATPGEDDEPVPDGVDTETGRPAGPGSGPGPEGLPE